VGVAAQVARVFASHTSDQPSTRTAATESSSTMNRPRPIQHRLERMLSDALDAPLSTEDPARGRLARGRLQRPLERLDDNLVEI
jgi:hypothetical protein